MKIQHKDTQLYLGNGKLEKSGASGYQVWEMINGGNGEFFLRNTMSGKSLGALINFGTTVFNVDMSSILDKTPSSVLRWKQSGDRIENVKANKCLANKSSLYLLTLNFYASIILLLLFNTILLEKKLKS